ncbi:hypothetical protein [Prescottella equi]|jgi:hypothetical protein|uniref:hypothetical protein n=1 Tax=Rhodococcus hoagii TaxID=43767 RepID=UPI00301BEC85
MPDHQPHGQNNDNVFSRSMDSVEPSAPITVNSAGEPSKNVNDPGSGSLDLD